MEEFPFGFNSTTAKEPFNVVGGSDSDYEQESESEFEDSLTSEDEGSFSVEDDKHLSEDEDAQLKNIYQDRGEGKRQLKLPRMYAQNVADAQKDLNSLDETSLTEILSNNHSSLDKVDDKKGYHTDRKEQYKRDGFVDDKIVWATEKDVDASAVSEKNIIEGKRKNKGQDTREYLINDPQYANILNKPISEKIAKQDAKQEKKDDEEEKKILERLVKTQEDENFVDGDDLSSDGDYQPSSDSEEHDTAQDPSNNHADPGAPYRHAEWTWDKSKEQEYKELEFYKADSPYEVHMVLFRKGKFSNLLRIEGLQYKYDDEDDPNPKHKYWFNNRRPSSNNSRKVDPTPARPAQSTKPNVAMKAISKKSKKDRATETKDNGKATTRKTKKVRAKKDERSDAAPNRQTTNNAKPPAKKKHKDQPSNNNNKDQPSNNNKKNVDITPQSQLKQHILVTIDNEVPMRVVLKNYTSSKLLKLDAVVIKNKFIRFTLTGNNQTTVVQGITFYNRSSNPTIKTIIDIAKSDIPKISKSSSLPINKKDVVDLLTPDEGEAKISPAPGARLQDDQNKIDKYIEDMRKKIRWGGEIEVRAAYQLYKISIRLFDVYENNCGKVHTYPSKNECEKKLDNNTINLLRTNKNHYDLIVCTEKTTPTTRQYKILSLTEKLLSKNDKMMAFCILHKKSPALDKKSPANETNNVPIKIIKIRKDGNCLFQSIFCFFKRQNLHEVMNLKNGMDVRQEICDYIKTNDELKNMILGMIEGDEADERKNKTKKKQRQQTTTQPTSSKENHTSPNVTKQLQNQEAVTNSKKPNITGPTNEADKTSQLKTTSLLELCNHPAWEMEGYVENDQYIVGKREAKTMWIKSNSPVPNFNKAKSILDKTKTFTLHVVCNHFFLDVNKCGLVSARLIVWTLQKTDGGEKYHKTMDTIDVWKKAQECLNKSFRSNHDYLNLNINKQNCYLLLDYDKIHAIQNNLNDKYLNNVGLGLEYSKKLLPEENERAELKNLKQHVTAQILMHTRRKSSRSELLLYPQLSSPANKIPNTLIKSEKFLYTSSYFVKLRRIAETGQFKFPICLVIWRIHKDNWMKLRKSEDNVDYFKRMMTHWKSIVQKIYDTVVSSNTDFLEMFQQKINKNFPKLLFHTVVLLQKSDYNLDALPFRKQLIKNSITKKQIFRVYLQPNIRVRTYNFEKALEELFGLEKIQKYLENPYHINELHRLRHFEALDNLNLNHVTVPFSPKLTLFSEALKLLRISNCTLRLKKTNEGYLLPPQLTHLNINQIYIDQDVISITYFVQALKLPQYLIHLNLSNNDLDPSKVLNKIRLSKLDQLQSLNLNGNRNLAYKHRGCELQFDEKHFKSLQHLFLSSTYLKALTLSIPLLELDVSCNRQLKLLKVDSLTSLTTLNISKTGIQDISFAKLPSLSTLRCCQNKFNFETFTLPKTVTSLYLSDIKHKDGNGGSAFLLKSLYKKTPNLMYLDISKNNKNLKKDDFKNITQFKQLRGLNLGENYLEMDTLNTILGSRGNDLKYLHLASNYLHVSTQFQRYAKNIVSLNLSRSIMIGKHFNASNLPASLKYLSLRAIGPLQNNNINFSHLLQLQQLDLAHNKFTAAHFSKLNLTNCTMLELLHVHGNPIKTSQKNKRFDLPENLRFIRFDQQLPKKMNCDNWIHRKTLQKLKPFHYELEDISHATFMKNLEENISPKAPNPNYHPTLTLDDVKYLERKNRLERVYATEAYQAFKFQSDMVFNYKRIHIAERFPGVREQRYLDYLPFRAVLQSIDTEPYEICGYVTHMEPSLHSMHFYKTDQGKSVTATKDKEYGQCEWSDAHPILWHTHVDGLPFWPSPPDLLKPVKHKEVHTSLVVGKYYNIDYKNAKRPNYIVWILSTQNNLKPAIETVDRAKETIIEMSENQYFSCQNKDKGIWKIAKCKNQKKCFVVNAQAYSTFRAFKEKITRFINNHFTLSHPYKVNILIFNSTHQLQHRI